MLKRYLMKYPLWFKIIWSCVVVAFIIVYLTGFNPVVLFGGMIVLYIANALRAWKGERNLAISSLIFAVVFSYVFYKFLIL